MLVLSFSRSVFMPYNERNTKEKTMDIDKILNIAMGIAFLALIGALLWLVSVQPL